MSEKVNVRTIAKSTNVSPITVSRALNGHPSVKTATRNKILKKVNELGYNHKAKSTTVKNRKLKNVALHCVNEKLHGDIYFNFYGQLYFLCINRLKMLGYTGHTFDLNDMNDEAMEELNECGSLILLSKVSHDVLQNIRKSMPDLNIVSIFAEERDFPTVIPDDVMGGEMASDYMIERNHRHVAVFTELEEPCFRQRYSGFFSRMIYKCPEADIDLIRFTNPPVQEAADEYKKEALDRYFESRKDLPTAIFAPNGYSAVFLCNYLRDRGLSVPNEIGIVGYDNYDYYQVIDVPLTRITFDLKTLARQAIQLLDNINKKKVSGKFTILIPVEMIDKDSVKKI